MDIHADIKYGSADYLLGLLRLAESKDKHFNPGDYKWKLGAYHYFMLKNEYDAKFGEAVQTEYDAVPMIFGVPVEVNYDSVHTVELWKNITNDL